MCDVLADDTERVIPPLVLAELDYLVAVRLGEAARAEITAELAEAAVVAELTQQRFISARDFDRRSTALPGLAAAARYTWDVVPAPAVRRRLTASERLTLASEIRSPPIPAPDTVARMSFFVMVRRVRRTDVTPRVGMASAH